jgi:WD40 repeat protein
MYHSYTLALYLKISFQILTWHVCLSCLQAAFSPDGAHVISGSTDSNVYVWQVRSPQICLDYLEQYSSYLYLGIQSSRTYNSYRVCRHTCPGAFFMFRCV